MRLVVNITCGLIGCLSIATGVFGSAYFQPPHGADPGAINAVWLTFFTLIFIGLTLVWGCSFEERPRQMIGRAKFEIAAFSLTVGLIAGVIFNLVALCM